MAFRSVAIVAAGFVLALFVGCSGGSPMPDVMDATTADVDGMVVDDGMDANVPDVAVDVQPLDVNIDCVPDIPPTPADASTPTFTQVYTQVLSHSCVAGVTCHTAGMYQENLVLSGDMATVYANVVGFNSVEVPGLMRVHPGQLDTSYLWLKLTGCFVLLPECQVAGMPCGGGMPLRPSPIADEYVQSETTLIRDWILAGAPNN